MKFSKEMVIGQDQVVPMVNSKMELTPVQEKLLKKLGPNAFPFTFNFPEMAPSSVKLCCVFIFSRHKLTLKSLSSQCIISLNR